MLQREVISARMGEFEIKHYEFRVMNYRFAIRNRSIALAVEEI